MPSFLLEDDEEDFEMDFNITVQQFVDSCSTEELKELVDYLIKLKLITNK